MTCTLIVALDFNNKKAALALVNKLDPRTCALKVGSELYTLLGASFVKQLIDLGFKVFLDLKFHDIPNTVARSCQVGADLGVWMMTLHATGGLNMMSSAQKALEPYGATRPLLLGVTVLTSFNQDELNLIGVHQPIADQVIHLAFLAQLALLDGVVCSAHEVQAIKNKCGKQFIAVTPGIRLAFDDLNDQMRVMTPSKARDAGSDYLVIGRSVTKALDPASVVAGILKEINSV